MTRLDHWRTCPWCQARHNAQTTVFEDDDPTVHFGLCWDCGEWTILENGELRKPTEVEFTIIGNDRDFAKLRAEWQRVKA